MRYTDPRSGITVSGDHPVAFALAKALQDDWEAMKDEPPAWCAHYWRSAETLDYHAIDTDGKHWVLTHHAQIFHPLAKMADLKPGPFSAWEPYESKG